jgi:hypothetical protein
MHILKYVHAYFKHLKWQFLVPEHLMSSHGLHMVELTESQQHTAIINLPPVLKLTGSPIAQVCKSLILVQ